MVSLSSFQYLVCLPFVICYHFVWAFIKQGLLFGGTDGITFFHPYCNDGGGGERVLWVAVRATMKQYPGRQITIMTGDKAPAGEILKKAKNRFGVEIPDTIQFKRLNTRHWVEDSKYPVLTMLGQALGSIVMGFEATSYLTDSVIVDTMGYAFAYPCLSILGGAHIAAYVHFPMISTDMLDAVAQMRPSYNNAQASSKGKTKLKLMLEGLYQLFSFPNYYKVFAWFYSYFGSYADLVMPNGSWTEGHIVKLWNPKICQKLYPPCDTSGLQGFDLGGRTPGLAVYVAQFRPEKDHTLLVKALKAHLDAHPASPFRLHFVGATRTQDDEERVMKLKELAVELDLQDQVEFSTNVSYGELKAALARAEVGVHAMWNEHFGIGVVEYQAAGLIPIAHKSGGPLMDIVSDDGSLGFLADSVESYADAFQRVLSLNDEEKQEIQVGGEAKNRKQKNT